MALTLDGTAGITFPNSTTQLVAGAPLTTPSFTTTIGVGAATASASGAGISFPATQSASSDANTLDDYEEGTWTPTITFGGNSAGQTFSSSGATYVKVGQMVLVQMNVFFSNKGSSTGNANVTGLPFTQNGSAFAMGSFAADGGFSGISSNGFGIYGLVANSQLYLRYNGSSGGYAALTDTNFTNTSGMYFSVVYRTDV